MPTTLTQLLANFSIFLTSFSHGPVNQDSFGFCPPDMAHVKGAAFDASNDLGEALQDMSCSVWINENFPARCAKFEPDVWKSRRKMLKTHELDFCIDRYEWPNIEGKDPQIFYTYYDAVRECMQAGKRLCNEEEWTFACEGEEGTPYPYGYERNANACNIDRPWIPPDYDRMFPPAKIASQEEELNRLWQGVPSGAMPTCVSGFGVHDMTGNVDEWTSSVRKNGYRSILKGGYWGPVRNRCRPSTRIHNEWHRNYQAGFRCCKTLSGTD